MSAPKNLEDSSDEELVGNWCANDQMLKSVGRLADEASGMELRERLNKSAKGMGKKDYAAEIASFTADICRADETMTDMTERSVNLYAND